MVIGATGYLRTMVHKSRSFSTSTPPSQVKKSPWMTADKAPIWMVGGFVLIAVSIAVHTAKQQLAHNPNVYFNKRRREMIPEVEEPSLAVKSGGKFIDKSFLRKIAHIQDDTKNTIPNPVRGSIYTKSRHAETLESIKD